MFAQTKQGFVSKLLIVGVLMTGTAIPTFAGTKDTIMGAVSNIDETALTLKVLNVKNGVTFTGCPRIVLRIKSYTIY